MVFCLTSIGKDGLVTALTEIGHHLVKDEGHSAPAKTFCLLSITVLDEILNETAG